MGVVRSSFALTLLLMTVIASAAEPVNVDFLRDIAPILRQQCVVCHGPSVQMAELRLDQRRFVLGEHADPDLVKPGKGNESLLVKRLTDSQLGILMPPTFPFPPGAKVGLPEATIDVLRSWIDQGAQWPADISLASDDARATATVQETALHAAIRAGDHRSAAELLGRDKELANTVDHRGETPLMHAGVYSDAAMVKLLLEHGANVNIASRDGATPLMRAAGDFDKAQLLLARGATIDAKSNLGRTPLLIAAAFPGNVRTVQLLLARGANVNDQDQSGDTCLASACKRGDAEMSKVLLEAGANVAAGESWFGRPPLVWAAEEGNVATLVCLLEHGAGKVQPHLDIALSSAAGRGPIEAVRLLLENGANPNAPSPIAGYTPLMWAAYHEDANLETVKLLLAKGANPKAQGANGESPLSLAKKRGNDAMAELLEQSQGAVAKDQQPVSKGHEKRVASAEQVRAAAEKGLALLQECGPKFFARSGCVACHQQSVTSLALAEARKRGIKVNERTAREQVQVTALFAKTFREQFLERADQPVSSPPSVGYITLGLAAENYQPDDISDALVIEMAGRQQLDGSWTAFSHRPPLEYSRIASTALAIRAMELYGPPGLKAQFRERIQRGRTWLLAAEPSSNHDRAFRLLGLSWSGADQKLLETQSDALLKVQRPDGGWSQHPAMESDAFATGLALYALHLGSNLAATHDAYQRGVDYLLKTQLADGSWHVKTRSFPFQTYFESGFPHGPDQWISATATGFATVALLSSLPPPADRR
jgi:ankyrin repeat protein